MLNSLIDLMTKSLLLLVALMGSIVVAGFILNIFKDIISRYMYWSLGYTGLFSTAWIGTPVHELGHALMCLIFGHKITKIRLLRIDKDLVLGYVNHSYNPTNIYHKVGNFFIGVAPILTGTGAILLLMLGLLPIQLESINKAFMEYSWFTMDFKGVMFAMSHISSEIFSIMFTNENIHNYKFWIFMVLAVSISSHMALSKADMKGALSGVFAIYLIVFMVNALTYLPILNKININGYLMIYNQYMIFALLISLLCSLCAVIISVALYTIKSVFISN